MDKLGEVLDELDLRTKVGGDSGLQALQAYLEVSQSSADFFSCMQSQSEFIFSLSIACRLAVPALYFGTTSGRPEVGS